MLSCLIDVAAFEEEENGGLIGLISQAGEGKRCRVVMQIQCHLSEKGEEKVGR